MEYLFIDEDGSLSVAGHIPEDVQKGHEAGVTTIINTAYGAVLNASKDWEEIREIPSPPELKHSVKMGGRGSAKANLAREHFVDSVINKTIGKKGG